MHDEAGKVYDDLKELSEQNQIQVRRVMTTLGNYSLSTLCHSLPVIVRNIKLINEIKVLDVVNVRLVLHYTPSNCIPL